MPKPWRFGRELEIPTMVARVWLFSQPTPPPFFSLLFFVFLSSSSFFPSSFFATSIATQKPPWQKIKKPWRWNSFSFFFFLYAITIVVAISCMVERPQQHGCREAMWPPAFLFPPIDQRPALAMAEWQCICVVVITCMNTKRGTRKREGEVEGGWKENKEKGLSSDKTRGPLLMFLNFLFLPQLCATFKLQGLGPIWVQLWK